MRKVQAQGSYSIPKEFDNAGANVTFNFEYEIFDGSFLVQRRDGRERIVLANVDNLPRLTVPGIPIVTE